MGNVKNTEIVFVLDKSGSMSHIKTDAIGGFNNFVQEQLKLEGDTDVTLVLFDHEVQVLEGVTELTEETYRPSGMTALLDAIGVGIDNQLEDLARKSEDDKPNVIVAIMTDGFENSSKEYTKERINEMITEQTANDWQFIFLGANIDAVGTARDLGINAKFAGGFVADGDGGSKAILHASEMVMSYRSTGQMSSYADVTKED